MNVWHKAHKHLSAVEEYIRLSLVESPASGLSVKQVNVLNCLYDRDGQSASELAKGIGYPATSFTPVLDALEMAGLIKRRPDPYDRRGIIIELTPKGQDYKLHIYEALDGAEKEFGKAIK
jgi:DNA-binding MarR family transcriptional regulator